MNGRRAQIFELVTESYIRSAHPVPSSWVAEQLRVSSATVRNDFCALEDAGYLQQPHTSAGRIPTAFGFGWYARKFIPPRQLPAPQKRLLTERLRGVHGDSLLQQIASVAADLSGYAVVVSLPADDSLTALEIHLSPLSSSRMLAVVVLENGLIRQLIVDLEPAPSDDVLREAESSLRQLTLPVGDVPEALQDIARRAGEELARTLKALAKAWPHMNPPRFFSKGLRNLLTEPESADPNFVRMAIERVEQPAPREAGANSDELDVVLDEALALVSARLELGSSRGGLMLLGPMRMRYPEVIMIAHAVTETVSEQLSPSDDRSGLN
jgi:heat-inducible transcriptional repressor